ncbi:quinone oxidoreductase, partial [Mesorhizobium sp. M00.F.Ca.ET.186.01.1.1]
KGQLDVKIGKVFSLEEAANAHAWVESRQSTGKVLLQVRP